MISSIKFPSSRMLQSYGFIRSSNANYHKQSLNLKYIRNLLLLILTHIGKYVKYYFVEKVYKILWKFHNFCAILTIRNCKILTCSICMSPFKRPRHHPRSHFSVFDRRVKEVRVQSYNSIPHENYRV